MLSVCLYQPEIPPNTGNIIRLCANAGSHLHLIKPLGFSLDEKSVKRSGLDYHDLTRVTEHDSWEKFTAHQSGKIYALSTKGCTTYTSIFYQPEDILLFGPETRGLPEKIRSDQAVTAVIKIPMHLGNRSLNLSNSVAILLFEAWRQLDFRGGIT